MDIDEIKERVQRGIDAFMKRDRYLLDRNLSERCIAGRLLFHLQNTFPGYDVDIEYNRAGDVPKRLNLQDECANSFDDDGNALVVPDIIIHKRGAEGPNLLGIEIKKQGDPRGTKCDRLRILALRKRFDYSFGALMLCETREGRKPDIMVGEWFA